MSEQVYIVAARRTPIGAFQGALSPLTSPQLGAAAVQAAIKDSGLSAEQIDETILGCVLMAGIGQAPGRQAALAGGVPQKVPATTINKMCGSGLKAVMMAADQIRAGSANVVLAGGIESMTNAPYLIPKARGGLRMGHSEILDHMFFDGLQSPFDGKMMGSFAEATAAKYGFTRQQQDEFAAESVRRALAAVEGAAFSNEVAPVTVKDRKGERVVAKDETPFTCDISKIPSLKPAFAKDGTVTAASSSSISDGAAALLIASASAVRQHNLKPLARIVGYTSHAQAPEWFTTAPVGAIQSVLAKTGWSAGDVDLYEINEAFAVVTMAAIKDVGLDPAKVNVNGGACALGHPIGATGARILTTLVHALRNRNLKRGVASLCIGGGEATALAVEII
ncbi:acetyl-CoA acetyltransferase [Steroidobacter agaridevorans]|uniref:Acetyl-CoA acetyltransferase n=1 Tax=Steroidobacter agaridevorans TaxID=2695856 RepID=A0A829YHZ2_9GAMM|nr:acetyl-CoA C-acyltransferase [Steroidobacter agaridevorans]GFE83015.1 acetyl-CoA acetyltransferase [Steroidobacter agaridevorans]